MGYLPAEFPNAGEMVDVADRRLLAAIIHSSDHVLQPLFPSVISRRPGLPRRQHEFTIPQKDNRNFFIISSFTLLIVHLPHLYLLTNSTIFASQHFIIL